jgi:AraC-like DNA-binding protein
MPHLPARNLLDGETILPGAASNSFWLKGSAWQFPDYENAETFVDRLVREEVLIRDPVVTAVLDGYPQERPSRTVRHRFLRATGLTQKSYHQFERARRAAAPTARRFNPCAVSEAGYFDQPHLTRSLKQWIGHTPAQVMRLISPQLEFCTRQLLGWFIIQCLAKSQMFNENPVTLIKETHANHPILNVRQAGRL